MTPTTLQAIRNVCGQYTSEAKAREIVRVVLESYREPTESMILASRAPVWEFSQDYGRIEKDPLGTHEDSAEFIGKKAWQAMIDAALEAIPGQDDAPVLASNGQSDEGGPWTSSAADREASRLAK